MNWKKILGVVYRLFLKGRTVDIGGNSVTFPQQGHGPSPQGQSKFDNTPSRPGIKPPKAMVALLVLSQLACGGTLPPIPPLPIPTALPTPRPTPCPTPTPTPTPPPMVGVTCIDSGKPCDCIDFPPPGVPSCAVCIRNSTGGIIDVKHIGQVPVCPPSPGPTPTPTPTPIPTPRPTPPVTTKCGFPQGVPDEQFVEVANPKTLASRLDAIVASRTGCAVNSDCHLGDQDPQYYLGLMVGWFQEGDAQGKLCAGQHRTGETDEVSVSSTCTGTWENYHYVNYGSPRKVSWSGGGARSGWMIPHSYVCGGPTPVPTPTPTPPPTSGCSSVPTPIANTGVIHCSVKPAKPSETWCDWTPKVNNRDFCAQWGQPQAMVVCPLRPEGHPERTACDYEYGMPMWSAATPAEGDPFHATSGRGIQVGVCVELNPSACVSQVTP